MTFRITAQDLDDVNAVSEPIVGRFRTAPADRRSVRFAWSGGTAGQGWGINPEAPTEGEANLPPSAGLQFFGLVDIDGATGQMTVRLMNRADTELWSTTLEPERQV